MILYWLGDIGMICWTKYTKSSPASRLRTATSHSLQRDAGEVLRQVEGLHRCLHIWSLGATVGKGWATSIDTSTFFKGEWHIIDDIWLVVWLPFLIFPYIGNFIIPIDVHIFQRGGPTTNQIDDIDGGVLKCLKWGYHGYHHPFINHPALAGGTPMSVETPRCSIASAKWMNQLGASPAIFLEITEFHSEA